MNMFIWTAKSKCGKQYSGVLQARDGDDARETLIGELKHRKTEVEDFGLAGVTSKTFQLFEQPSELSLFLIMLKRQGYTEVKSEIKILDPKEFSRTVEASRCFITNHKIGEINKDVTILTLGEGFGFRGYSAEFAFDKDGRFLMHGVWE